MLQNKIRFIHGFLSIVLQKTERALFTKKISAVPGRPGSLSKFVNLAQQMVADVTGIANMLLEGFGNEEALKFTYYAGAAVALVACVGLIPTYGVVRRTIATVLTLAVQNLSTVSIVRKCLRMKVLPALKF